MRAWIQRHFGALATVAFVSALTLLVLDLWKYGFLRPKFAADYKDAVDVWSKAASSAILLTGAVLSYFRFFYGRTLSRRADVALAVTSILDPRGDRLHSAIVTVKNVGTVTIWHPKPSIEVRLHCDARPEGSPSLQVTVERVQRNPSDWKTSTSLIEPGESVSYCFLASTPSASWAATFLATVSCDSGDVWSAYATVATDPIAEDPDTDFE